MIRGCLDNFGSWLMGGVSLVAGLWVMLSVPRAETPLFTGLLGLLLLHTSAMSIVGFALKKATRVLAISWVILLLAFLIVAAILYA